jgi:hypothetical protein
MSATAPRRTRPSGDLAQTGVVALLLAVAAITWALTHRRMAGMDAGPGSDLGGLGWFAATWALMMAAMMLPRWSKASARSTSDSSPGTRRGATWREA